MNTISLYLDSWVDHDTVPQYEHNFAVGQNLYDFFLLLLFFIKLFFNILPTKMIGKWASEIKKPQRNSQFLISLFFPLAYGPLSFSRQTERSKQAEMLSFRLYLLAATG